VFTGDGSPGVANRLDLIDGGVLISKIHASVNPSRFLVTDNTGAVNWDTFKSDATYFQGTGFDGFPLSLNSNLNLFTITDGTNSFNTTIGGLKTITFTGSAVVDPATRTITCGGNDNWGTQVVQHDASLVGNGLTTNLLGMNLANANTWTGTQTFGTVIAGDLTATTLAGDGSAITNLTAASITGVIAKANLPATVAYEDAANNFTLANTFSAAGTALSVTNDAQVGGTLTAGAFVGNGSALTNLNGSAITTGIVGKTHLPATVAYVDQSNTFSQTNTFTNDVAFTGAGNGIVVENNASFSGGIVQITNGDIEIQKQLGQGNGSYLVENTLYAYEQLFDYVLTYGIYTTTTFGGVVNGTYDNLQFNPGVVDNTAIANATIFGSVYNGATHSFDMTNGDKELHFAGNVALDAASHTVTITGDNWGTQTAQTNATLSGNGTTGNLLGLNLANANTWTGAQTLNAHTQANGLIDYNSNWTVIPAGVTATTLVPKGYVDSKIGDFAILDQNNQFTGVNSFGLNTTDATEMIVSNNSSTNPTMIVKNFYNALGGTTVALQVSGMEGTTAIDVPTGDLNVSAGRFMATATSDDQALVYLTNNGTAPAIEVVDGCEVLSHDWVPSPTGATLDLTLYASKSIIIITGTGTFTTTNIQMPAGFAGQTLHLIRKGANNTDVYTIGNSTLTGNGVATFIYATTSTGSAGEWLRVK
jgi:hypothetical protein